MKSRSMGWVVAALFLPVPFTESRGADVSRANCFNNESISWSVNFVHKWRVVISHHYYLGVKRHFVTEAPIYYPACVPGFAGNHDIYGNNCEYRYYKYWRHAGIHGSIFSSDNPHPDGDLTQSDGWTVLGQHHTWIKPIDKFLYASTEAVDCGDFVNAVPIPPPHP